jgi:hypothetical protein
MQNKEIKIKISEKYIKMAIEVKIRRDIITGGFGIRKSIFERSQAVSFCL